MSVGHLDRVLTVYSSTTAFAYHNTICVSLSG